MVQEVLRITSGIVSVYFVILTVICGIICIFSVGPYIKSGGFKKEAAIAKYGGIAYIVGSIGLYLGLKLFA